MTTNQLVQQIKKNDEDFEWYPTTTEIVKSVADYLSKFGENPVQSILDIGCGNGSFFEKLDNAGYFNDGKAICGSHLIRNYRKYGFEKSNILAEQLPEDVILLGSDFLTNTLIDKKVDVIFCNPPYTQYEMWAERIILESNSNCVILVIPHRWESSDKIKYALQKRKYKAEIIGNFDFSNAERKARAEVDVIAITPQMVIYGGHHYAKERTDPFDIWFNDTFSFNAEKSNNDSYFAEQEKEKAKQNEIIEKGDTAEMLVKFYNDDMQKLYDNYRALERLDSELFKELKVDIKMLKESLKARLQGLKHIYWDLLFQKYERITCRLTTEGKRKVTEKLQDNTAIDFTLENIFQLTMWIIRHSNTLYDEQLSDFFFKLCDTENIHRYKSNKRWNDDDWKYLKTYCKEYGTFRQDRAKEKLKNVTLDYRIVVTSWKNFDTDWSKCRLSKSCIEFLYDLSVIAENLGFRTDLKIPDIYDDVEMSDWSNFDIHTKDGKLFCNVKLYKNGNRHLKFDKDFMQKLNVEMARINGWLHSKEEVKEEMQMTESEVNSVWKSNLQIESKDCTKLLGLSQVV